MKFKKINPKYFAMKLSNSWQVFTSKNFNEFF